MSMKHRTYKELEGKPSPLSQSDIEAAKQAFLSSGGTVQVVTQDDKTVRRQRKAAVTLITRHK